MVGNHTLLRSCLISPLDKQHEGDFHPFTMQLLLVESAAAKLIVQQYSQKGIDRNVKNTICR